jgi:hypothetical protein
MADCIYTEAEGSIPKWSRILAQVMRDLEADGFASRDRFYTIRELAGNYGVSVITAQRVFRELAARRLIETQGRRGTVVKKAVGVEAVHVCLRDDYFSSQGDLRRFQSVNAFFDGVKSGADGRFADLKTVGLRFLLGNLKSFAGKPVLISANAFLSITPNRIALDAKLLERVGKALSPILFHGGFGNLSGVSQVGTNLYGGIRLAVDHLAAAGHERIGCLMGAPENVWFRPRLQAYMDGLFEQGLSFELERLKITSGNDRAEDFRAIEAILATPRPPTAIVCANDSRAFHVLEYCARQKIVVPGSLAVTGYDNIPEGALCEPPLTTIDGRDREMGRRCADLLLRQSQGGLKAFEQIVVEPELIVRGSG